MSITAPVGEDVDIASINYTMWSVFATRAPLPADDRERSGLVVGAHDAASETGVTVRGWYDVAGLRADADLMVWWHAPSIEQVQSAYRNLLSSPLGPSLTRVWSGVALHRPAEFNKAHVPAYLAGDPPGRFMCVYPFVRSYDWYLLPAEHRRQMLADHGSAARDYPDVRANTVAAFALGDYEWILSLESNELHRLVDLMRELRGTEARRYVREEVPFFTGTRTSLEEWIDRQPRA